MDSHPPETSIYHPHLFTYDLAVFLCFSACQTSRRIWNNQVALATWARPRPRAAQKVPVTSKVPVSVGYSWDLPVIYQVTIDH